MLKQMQMRLWCFRKASATDLFAAHAAILIYVSAGLVGPEIENDETVKAIVLVAKKLMVARHTSYG